MKYSNSLPPTQLSPAAQSFYRGHFTFCATVHVLLCIFYARQHMLLYVYFVKACFLLMCNKYILQVTHLCLKASPPGCSLWNLQLCQCDTTPTLQFLSSFSHFYLTCTLHVSRRYPACPAHAIGCEIPSLFKSHMCNGTVISIACKEFVLQVIIFCLNVENNLFQSQIKTEEGRGERESFHEEISIQLKSVILICVPRVYYVIHNLVYMSECVSPRGLLISNRYH